MNSALIQTHSDAENQQRLAPQDRHRSTNPKYDGATAQPRAQGTQEGLANGPEDDHRSRFGECAEHTASGPITKKNEAGLPRSFDELAAHLDRKFARLTTDREQMCKELHDAAK